MSCRDVQDIAAAAIDSLEFAARGDCIAGKLAVARLPRLADVLANRDGWLDCELSGWHERGREGAAEDKLGLRLRVSGRLGMSCQRCLAEVGFDCRIDSRLLLVPAGTDWPEDELEAEEYDAIPAERELSVLSLVEEEVLLALPPVSRHEKCGLPGGPGPQEEESRPSPFAVLAGLKKH
jgi:uncharacterized protein